MTWQPISTAPKDEINPFLVLLPGKDVCKTLAVQVSNFEGRMYPDCRDGIIDWERCDNHSNPLAAPFPAARNRWRGLMEAQILIQLIIITVLLGILVHVVLRRLDAVIKLLEERKR